MVAPVRLYAFELVEPPVVEASNVWDAREEGAGDRSTLYADEATLRDAAERRIEEHYAAPDRNPVRAFTLSDEDRARARTVALGILEDSWPAMAESLGHGHTDGVTLEGSEGRQRLSLTVWTVEVELPGTFRVTGAAFGQEHFLGDGTFRADVEGPAGLAQFLLHRTRYGGHVLVEELTVDP